MAPKVFPTLTSGARLLRMSLVMDAIRNINMAALESISRVSRRVDNEGDSVAWWL